MGNDEWMLGVNNFGFKAKYVFGRDERNAQGVIFDNRVGEAGIVDYVRFGGSLGVFRSQHSNVMAKFF